ncbi:hypothetical protein JCM19037_155 [Geomicrobium sp. JCM 19037]|uniref:DUF4352 domain-containing protein n=1 Tax=unclassified Geomicrobium TaxID=2628951 RepID=UPI00045F1272|nr:DUF4352 domain-containing protein [Geomicrobium sp. JCM 19037]GAK01958.1 hypothetical protein JCM19037_155 [Geomicrobium sp. JCM 19037]
MGWKYWTLMGLVLVLGFMAGMAFEGRGQSDNLTSASDDLLTDSESARIGNLDISVVDAYAESNEETSYVIVDVMVVNQTESSAQFAPLNTSIVDEEGYEYRHDSSFGDQRLMGGQIRPGGQRRGTLSYEVPNIDSQFEWIYSHHATGEYGAWDVNTAAE